MLRPIKVRQHLNFMKSLGYAPEAVLEDTGIDAARLNDAEYLVDARQCHAVVSNMIRISKDSGLGLKLGAGTNLNDLGIVGYAMASSSTLGQAIGLWRQYGNSPVGSPFTLKLIAPDAQGHWSTTATSSGISGSVYRFYVEETLTMGMSFARLLTGEALQLKSISFSFPAPPHWQQYKRRFSCPIEFDAPLTRAIVRSPTLDTPVKSNDHELRELCIRHCSHLVRKIAREGPVASRLRECLTAGGTIPSLEAAAESLNLSSRSLRRHLHKEGTSFQNVLDEFRHDLAREYLGTGIMSAKEVAFLLGFSQVDSFRRAFKTWTGQTVSAFQARR